MTITHPIAAEMKDESIHGNDDHRYLGNVGILEDDQDVNEDELTSNKLAKQASDALKSLENVRRRDLDKSATKDQFVLVKIILCKFLGKKCGRSSKNQLHKRELIFQSMDYFQSEMTKWRMLLDDGIERSKENSYDYQQPE
jgi:hypothetical protein